MFGWYPWRSDLSEGKWQRHESRAENRLQGETGRGWGRRNYRQDAIHERKRKKNLTNM